MSFLVNYSRVSLIQVQQLVNNTIFYKIYELKTSQPYNYLYFYMQILSWHHIAATFHCSPFHRCRLHSPSLHHTATARGYSSHLVDTGTVSLHKVSKQEWLKGENTTKPLDKNYNNGPFHVTWIFSCNHKFTCGGGQVKVEQGLKVVEHSRFSKSWKEDTIPKHLVVCHQLLIPIMGDSCG